MKGKEVIITENSKLPDPPAAESEILPNSPAHEGCDDAATDTSTTKNKNNNH